MLARLASLLGALGATLAAAACSDDGGSDPNAAGGSGGGGGAGLPSAGQGAAGAPSAGQGAAGAPSAGQGGTAMAGAAGQSNGGGGSGGSSGSGAAGSPSTAGSNAEAGSSGQAGSEPAEKALVALPEVRQEHSAVTLKGEVYVIAGFTPDVTASVAAYDPAADRWRSVADLPVAMQHANAGVVGDKIYVAGYYAGKSFSNVEGRVFEYDPAANDWTEKTAMPGGTERSSGCVAVLDGKLYVFGGARGGTVDDTSAYDATADSWEPLPDLPEPREHCVAGVIGGKLYVASGRSGGIAGFRPKTWAYDPVARSYEEKAAIPTPRGGTAGAVLRGRLFVFGGEGSAAEPRGVFPNVEAYDPVSDTWDALPDMTVPRHGFAAAVLDDRIYLPGGATTQGFGAVDDHSVFYYE